MIPISGTIAPLSLQALSRAVIRNNLRKTIEAEHPGLIKLRTLKRSQTDKRRTFMRFVSIGSSGSSSDDESDDRNYVVDRRNFDISMFINKDSSDDESNGGDSIQEVTNARKINENQNLANDIYSDKEMMVDINEHGHDKNIDANIESMFNGGNVPVECFLCDKHASTLVSCLCTDNIS